MKIETSAGAFDSTDFATGFRFPAKSGNGTIRVSPITNSDKWRIVHNGTATSMHLAADGAWREAQFLSPDALADADLLGHEMTRALALAYEYAQES